MTVNNHTTSTLTSSPTSGSMTSRIVSSDTATIDLEQVGALLTAAFYDEPVTRWLVPDPFHRALVMPTFFTHAAEHAAAAGWVDILTDDQGHAVGAALWFDCTGRDEAPDPDPRLADVLGPDAANRWRVMDDQMTRTHPTGPHHYLMLLGVHPDLQGCHLSSRLLDHRHAEAGGQRAYLEATTPGSQRLYERHGYRSIGHLQLPTGPVLIPMSRPAGTPTDALDGVSQ